MLWQYLHEHILIFPQNPIHSVHRMDSLWRMSGLCNERATCLWDFASFVAEFARHIVNESGNCQKRKKDGLIVKTAECCPRDLDSSTASAQTSCVILGKSLKPAFSQVVMNCVFLIFWVPNLGPRVLICRSAELQLKSRGTMLWALYTTYSDEIRS